MTRKNRPGLLLLLALLFAAGIVVLLYQLVIPTPPPAAVDVPKAGNKALTGRVALIIIDGLRYDIGVDSEQMPYMARRMKETGGTDIWANQVTMTTSAITTYATGQRGDLDQVVNNETASPTPYNHLIENARNAGLTTAAVGDKGWFATYPNAWDFEHRDPRGVAIDVDYNDEIFEAAFRLLKEKPKTNLMVIHFVTPDHQGHAYGTKSDRYRAHILGFDGKLKKLLEALPKDTTVFVTSDHGATDGGRHGSDLPIERRCPIYAYGPGLNSPLPEAGRTLHQIDLATTFATLLGVASPAQSRGHLITSWLKMAPKEKTAAACHDLQRLAHYAGAELGQTISVNDTACDTAAPPEDALQAAAQQAQELDALIASANTRESKYGFLAPVAAILGALLLGILLLAGFTSNKDLARLALLVTAMVVGQAFWNWQMERFSDAMHVGLYIALTAVADLTLVYAFFRSRRTAEWIDKHLVLAALLFPGILIVSYTRTTWPQSYIVAAALTLLACTVGIPRLEGRSLYKPSQWVRGTMGLLIAVLLLGLLYRVGFKAQNHLPDFIRKHDPYPLWLALGCIPIFAFFRHKSDERATVLLTVVGCILAVGSLWFRRSAPVEICLLGWGGLAVTAGILIMKKGPRSLIELLLLGSWAWVSRDNEVWVVVVTYLLADRVASGIKESTREDTATLRPSVILFCVTFLFTFCFIQRVGVQLGLDFMYYDWGAGSFRDPNVSMGRIGLAIVYKMVIPRAAVVFLILAALSPLYRLWTIRALFVAEAIRAASLATMLYVSRHSFWTAMRVMGDVPHALIAVLVAAGAFAIVAYQCKSDVPNTQSAQEAVR